MRIAELFRKKRAVWSFEVFPPKQQSGMGSVNATLEELKDLAPDYVSVTYSAGGSRVLLTDDYDILVDVVKLAGGVYEPVPFVGGLVHTFRYDRERETGYSRDSKNVYAHPLDGESAVLYTWTADDRNIWDFAVTENGTLAVIVRETDNRSLYVDGELLREDVLGIAYADDESILATLGDGRLELIPMP